MNYTLVEYSDRFELENPDGEVIAEYQHRVGHPKETAADIEADFSNNPQDMFLFFMEQRWEYRIEEPFDA